MAFLLVLFSLHLKGSALLSRISDPAPLPSPWWLGLTLVLLPPDPFFGQRYIHILGRQKLYHVVKYTGGSAELLFFVEGLRFPDDGFPGLVSIHVSLLEYMTEVRAPGLHAGLPLGAGGLLPGGHAQDPPLCSTPLSTKGEPGLGDLQVRLRLS